MAEGDVWEVHFSTDEGYSTLQVKADDPDSAAEKAKRLILAGYRFAPDEAPRLKLVRAVKISDEERDETELMLDRWYKFDKASYLRHWMPDKTASEMFSELKESDPDLWRNIQFR